MKKFETIISRLAVCITNESREQVIGSGVLCVLRNMEKAVVITAAHVVRQFHEEKICLIIRDVNDNMHCITLDTQNERINNQKNGQIIVHPDYKYEDETSSFVLGEYYNDIAIINLPWKTWMSECTEIKIYNCNISDRICGYGFPLSHNNKRADDCGGRSFLSGYVNDIGKRGYNITSYTIQNVEGIPREDTMEGYSGTGLFVKGIEFVFLTGIVSQSSGDEAAGNTFWASQTDWIFDIDNDLKSIFVSNIQKTELIEVLKKDCGEQIKNSQNSGFTLSKLETDLYPDGIDEITSKAYISSDNQTALLARLKEMSTDGEKRSLLVTGEGGIGKTATMLGSCQYLLYQDIIVFYIPLRNIGCTDVKQRHLKRYIIDRIPSDPEYQFVKRYVRDMLNNPEEIGFITYLFLDGYNELRQDVRKDVKEELGYYKNSNNKICIVFSSRRSLEEDGYTNYSYTRLSLKRLDWNKKVCPYLKEKGIDVTENEINSEILGIPLMLKLYTDIRLNIKENSEVITDRQYLWRKKLNTRYNILWDYIQCQICNAWKNFSQTNDNSIYDYILAAEYIVPFIAEKMNSTGGYVFPKKIVLDWLNEGQYLMEIFRKSERIQTIEDSSNIGWYSRSYNQYRIYDILITNLNLLRFEYIDNDPENTTEASVYISFVHQDFQDILHYIFIEESIRNPQFSNNIEIFKKSRVPYDVITMIAQNMDIKDIEELWKKEKKDKYSDDYAFYNLVEVFRRLYDNDLSRVDLSDTNLKNVNLMRTTLSSVSHPASFRNAIIGENTFSTAGHFASVTKVEFSTSGGKFLSASYDKTIRIWNTSTGECLKTLKKHAHYVRCAKWSPNDCYIVSGSDDRQLLIWNTEDCLENDDVEPTIIGNQQHQYWILSVGWNQNGKMLASGDSGGNVYIWNKENADEFCLIHKMYFDGEVNCIEWSPTRNSIIAFGTSKGKGYIYDIKEEKRLLLSINTNRIQAISWSPKGDYLALATGKRIYVREIPFSEKHNNVISNINDKNSGWNLIYVGNSDIVDVKWADRNLVFCERRELFIINIEENTIVRGRMPDSQNCSLQHLSGHTSDINSISWSQHENRIISGSNDSTIRIWKPRNPTWNSEWNCAGIIGGNNNAVRCVSWSDEQNMIVAGYDDGWLRKWNVNNKICCGIMKGHEKPPKCVEWIGDNIVSGANDGMVCVWDAKSCKCLESESFGSAVNSIKCFRDNKRIVIGTNSGDIYIWNYKNGSKKILQGHLDGVYCVILSSDEKYIISASKDCTVRFWDPIDGICYNEKTITQLHSNAHQQPIRAIAYSPLTQMPMLVTASNDATIRRWSMISKSGSPIPWEENETLISHKDYIYCMAWSPKGDFIISGSTDNNIGIWKASTGKLIKMINEHSNYILSVAWAKDGTYFASASADGKICIWKVWKLEMDDQIEVELVGTIVAMSSVDIMGCNFSGAIFESDELALLIKMNGGIVDEQY